ncbi:MAG TPA: LptF/LptG family permease, partial [Planctomycetaceae bacterium]|nr:LptF/LptG family permease [Planctomycetaceae bacterium]
MTTFDRYLLRRFWHVFGIGFFATVGLYVVFDGFTNVDAFQDRAGGASALVVLGHMAQFYAYQATVLFDLVAPILTVVSTMVVFTLLQKNREIHPILSAGVPTFRLIVPLLIGTLAVNGLLMLNQEMVFPELAGELLKPIGSNAHDGQEVQTRRDFSSHIEISGQRLFLTERTLRNAEFLLPAPELVSEITTLKCEQAVYQRKSRQRPAGWHLQGAVPRVSELRLTPAGRKLLLPTVEADEVFVVTDIGCEQLLDVATSYRYQSTVDLIERLRNPTFSAMTARSQVLHLHERLTRPLFSVLAVCLAVPLVLRKESFSLITNLAACTGVMMFVLVLKEASVYLGRMNWVSQDLAIWLPIIVSGG